MPFRVVVFSAIAPIEPFRLMDRIEREIPGAQVAGLLYELRPPKPLRERAKVWRKNFAQPGYLPYVLSRVRAAAAQIIGSVGHALLRFAQASSAKYHNPEAMSFDELREHCHQRGWAMYATTEIHGQQALDFVRQLNTDLGVVLGTRILKPVLYEIPKQGSINIHKRKVPDYRGAGPVALWEMLDQQTEIGVTVHRVAEKVDTGAVVGSQIIPVEPLDTLGSMALKAGLVGEELLLAAVRDFVNGSVQDRAQTGTGKLFKGPKAHELHTLKNRIQRLRPPQAVRYARPRWKLLLRSALYLFYLPARNWLRRWRKNFPVVVLYHHLVCDRKHPMGQATQEFQEHIRYLKKHYRLASLAEALAMLRSGKVAEPTVVVTLDDGYADNFINLRSVLRAEQVPVCLFVCSRLVMQGEMFPHDRRDKRAGFPPMTPQQLRTFADENVEIGSHTQTHYDCGQDDRQRLESEIATSRRELEQVTGKSVAYFSFPWGKHANMCESARQIAEQNYECYFSAYGGVNSPGPRGKHLERLAHPFSLWELELTLQNILEFHPAGRVALQPGVPVTSAAPAAGKACPLPGVPAEVLKEKAHE